MTDPNEYVAGQLGQMAGPAEPAAHEELAEAVASQGASSGVTEADIDAIRAQLASFQRQLNEQAAAQAKAAPDALTSSVAALRTYAEGHGDAAVLTLLDDAAEAAKNATSSGDTGPLAQIIARVEKHLRRNPPGPGDRFHYLNALDAAAEHLPDVIDGFRPPSSTQAVASDRAPAKVVAGSVVG